MPRTTTPTRPTGRWRAGGSRAVGLRRRRWLVALAVLFAAVLLAPVPWMHAVQDQPRGNVWRLDGRLVVEGEVVDPPGRWSWLTVGRPPVVAELLWARVTGDDAGPRDMRDAPRLSRPSSNEPLAAAVGLVHAGRDLRFGLSVEVSGPRLGGYPQRAVVVEVNGVGLTDRMAWYRAMDLPTETTVFRTSDGRQYEAPGTGLPYESVELIDVSDVDAAVGGRFANLAPVGWFRDLALGRSHGLMVALTTYAHATGLELQEDLHVAGTGAIQVDGTVTRIGGLSGKAVAARRAGADVLYYPAVQGDELEGFVGGTMELVPVATLSEAIEHLERR